MVLTRYDRIAGCIFGGAIGDALGYPVEFDSLETIRIRYGDNGVLEPPIPAYYSDDTQMTLRVARGLSDSNSSRYVASYGEVLKRYTNNVIRQLILWADEDPPRAPGASCLYGVANLRRGTPWNMAGKPESKGCGAVMRSAPYGLLIELSNAGFLAGSHALMTHNHPAAQASSAALAAGIAAIMMQVELSTVVKIMSFAADAFDRKTATMIQWAAALSKDADVSSASVLNEWRGWTGDEAIAASLYCFLKKQDDYQGAVRLAVNSSGDSDSLGSITGNLSGAYLGVSGIPQEWLNNIENADLLADISLRLSKHCACKE